MTRTTDPRKKATIAEYEARVAQAYGSVSERKAAIRLAAKAEEAEVDRTFARVMHEAHSKGVSKRTLMEITRKGGNWYAFSSLWESYEPLDGEFEVPVYLPAADQWTIKDVSWKPAGAEEGMLEPRRVWIVNAAGSEYDTWAVGGEMARFGDMPQSGKDFIAEWLTSGDGQRKVDPEYTNDEGETA